MLIRAKLLEPFFLLAGLSIRTLAAALQKQYTKRLSVLTETPTAFGVIVKNFLLLSLLTAPWDVDCFIGPVASWPIGLLAKSTLKDWYVPVEFQ